jgi:hypothetical protein
MAAGSLSLPLSNTALLPRQQQRRAVCDPGRNPLLLLLLSRCALRRCPLQPRQLELSRLLDTPHTGGPITSAV